MELIFISCLFYSMCIATEVPRDRGFTLHPCEDNGTCTISSVQEKLAARKTSSAQKTSLVQEISVARKEFATQETSTAHTILPAKETSAANTVLPVEETSAAHKILPAQETLEAHTILPAQDTSTTLAKPTVQETLTIPSQESYNLSIYISTYSRSLPSCNMSNDQPLEISPELLFGGVLYPRASESRHVLSLDGLWNFKLGGLEEVASREKWFEKDISRMNDVTLMPVPSSYNDITTSYRVRDHVGSVWYQRTFFVPQFWNTQEQRTWLRFGSVNYLACVWINGGLAIAHEFGHMPFQFEITKLVRFGQENRLTVSVDNRLGPKTVPQGTLEPIYIEGGEKKVQKYSYGFYNYAGIHGSVYLYSTPKVFIDDITLKNTLQGDNILLHYRLFCKGVSGEEEIKVDVSVIDKDDRNVGFHSQKKIGVSTVSGVIEINNPKLWWPFLMSPNPGYMHTVKITVKSLNTGITDVYRHPFGLRSITWDHGSVSINDKPIYIQGISRHADSDIRGRSVDLAVAVRDHNLLGWLGANTYRMSHCPHSEESMDLADRMGFMVIDEAPSINTENFTDTLVNKHRSAVAQLINRDKNRACVIMWSVANEPVSEIKPAGPYFGAVVVFARSRDDTRPITAILNRWSTADKAGQWMDVICFNRYNGYFKEPGYWSIIRPAVEREARLWRKKLHKPVIMSEYGTEAYEGLHGLPGIMWTEEFQNKVLFEHFEAFDKLREERWFIGEMVYCFADYKTDESMKRVGGRQKKGIFTRQRQPKSAAFAIRSRYFGIVAKSRNETIPPNDLDSYVERLDLTTHLLV